MPSEPRTRVGTPLTCEVAVVDETGTPPVPREDFVINASSSIPAVQSLAEAPVLRVDEDGETVTATPAPDSEVVAENVPVPEAPRDEADTPTGRATLADFGGGHR
jgi:hypothetical protein